MQIDFSNGESYDILFHYSRYNFPYTRARTRNIKSKDLATIEEMNLTDDNFARRQFKCIEIMKHLDHENILTRFSVHYKNRKYYFVTENLSSDLYDVIYYDCPLENRDFKIIIYQVLQGLLALHSAGIVHNHICPEAIWINEDLDVKFSEFLFATEVNKEYNDIIAGWTTYAPEIICEARHITGKADIWSCGCILYELVARKPFLIVGNISNAIMRIIEKIGMPDEDDMYFVEDEYLTNLWSFQDLIRQNIIENDDKLLIDLLNKMLVFNPLKRWDAEKCLQHPYFEEILEYFPNTPKISDKLFDWNELKKKIPRKEILKMINL